MSHSYQPDVSFDGGALDCGSGLLLLIRRHIDPLARGGLLEIRSTEPTVADDLPAWCRLTGNELVSVASLGHGQSFLVCKGTLAERQGRATDGARPAATFRAEDSSVTHQSSAQQSMTPKTTARETPQVKPLSVMGIGSWPRPRWLLRAIHERLEGRSDEAAFHETADDAVRLAIEAQRRAGVDVFTDGEQRRDSYASFVGGLLDNCQLIPVTDLLPYVDNPEEFAAELRALDVPAESVRHPAVFGPIRRSRPLAGGELAFAQSIAAGPVKIALPGPYLLTRTMWLECVTDRAYAEREALADDVVRVLREELVELLDSGAALVQFDEPVLSEVVFGTPVKSRGFMCGALSERRSSAEELRFASTLVNRVVAGLPRERVALHMCRGNWSRDESIALAGDYRPLLETLAAMNVGTYFLELCTPRAGEMEVLRDLPRDRRIGVGVVNQKLDQIESVDDIARRVERAADLFGADRVLLNPDCGFATFADNPVASAEIAERKLAAIVAARDRLR